MSDDNKYELQEKEIKELQEKIHRLEEAYVKANEEDKCEIGRLKYLLEKSKPKNKLIVGEFYKTNGGYRAFIYFHDEEKNNFHYCIDGFNDQYLCDPYGINQNYNDSDSIFSVWTERDKFEFYKQFHVFEGFLAKTNNGKKAFVYYSEFDDDYGIDVYHYAIVGEEVTYGCVSEGFCCAKEKEEFNLISRWSSEDDLIGKHLRIGG